VSELEGSKGRGINTFRNNNIGFTNYIMTLEQQLQRLREEWKVASPEERKNIEKRADILKEQIKKEKLPKRRLTIQEMQQELRKMALEERKRGFIK
jgi:hypothetical protein